MAKTMSAGILMYRRRENGPEVFLVHPGGPFFRKKDAGWWTIPKGLVEEGEDFEQAARREFTEETGIEVVGELLTLGNIRQKSGKIVHGWAWEQDWEGELRSNTFEIEWPPRSGKRQNFPEADEGKYFGLAEAKEKMMVAQWPFVDRLVQRLNQL